MHLAAILLAAGRGERLKSRLPKLLLKIKHQPVIIYSLKALSLHPDVRDIIVVASVKTRPALIKKIRQYRISKVRRVILGGRRRQDSVFAGLKALDTHADFVLVHDAARPFINKKIISRVIKQAKQSGAAIAGVPVKDTIKEVHSPQSIVHSKSVIVKRTLDRKSLWEIQTPQVFKRGLLLKAHRKFRAVNATDDAMLVEKLGTKVAIVAGSYANIKITTAEDLLLAKTLARRFL